MSTRKRRDERRRTDERRRKDEASAAFASGKLVRAAELYARLAIDCPGDPQILVRLGEVQRRRGRDAEAITAFLRAGGRLTRDGHFLRAIAAYRIVLEISPGHEGAHALLADLHERRLGRPLTQSTSTPPAARPAAAHEPATPRTEDKLALGRIALARGAVEARSIATASTGPGEPKGPDRSVPRPGAFSPGPPIGTATPPIPVLHFSRGPSLEPAQLDELLYQIEIDADDFDDEVETPPLPPIPLFADLAPEAFQRLVAGSRRIVVAPGERAVTQGEPGDSFFVVVRGALEVVREGKGLAERLAVVEEGAFFGEMALLTGTPRTASVWAVEESELLLFTARDLRLMVQQYPSVATALRRFYRQRLLSNVLSTSPVFRRFDRMTSSALIGRFRTREVAAGEIIVEEGKPVGGLFVVLHGTFEVARLERGLPTFLATLGEGELFGEQSLLHGGAAVATCTARSRGMVLRLPRESFEELINELPELRAHLEAIDQERRRNCG